MSLTLVCNSIQNILSPFSRSALGNDKGEIFYIQTNSPVDFGTFGETLKNIVKYFKMEAGDIILLNDPFSGGTHCQELTWVGCLKPSQNSSAGIYLISRDSISEHIRISRHQDEEGIRIPPAPLAHKGVINQALLEALNGHPLASPKMNELNEHFAESFQRSLNYFRKSEFESYEKSLYQMRRYSQTKELEKLRDKSMAETEVELPLESGEMLKLKLSLQDKSVNLDFRGTSAGKNLFIPASVSLGCSYYFLKKYYQFQNDFHDGSHELIQITQPQGSFINCRFPHPTLPGSMLAPALLSTALDLALQKIHSKPQRGLNNYFSLKTSLYFSSGNPWTIELPSGTGAIEGKEPLAGLNLLSQSSFPSLEQAEKYPLQFVRADHRNSQTGKGRLMGGRGLILKFNVLAEGEMHYISDPLKRNSLHLRHHSQSEPCQILIERGPEEIILSGIGKFQFQTGDQISLCTGTGSGLI